MNKKIAIPVGLLTLVAVFIALQWSGQGNLYLNAYIATVAAFIYGATFGYKSTNNDEGQN